MAPWHPSLHRLLDNREAETIEKMKIEQMQVDKKAVLRQTLDSKAGKQSSSYVVCFALLVILWVQAHPVLINMVHSSSYVLAPSSSSTATRAR